MPKIDLRHAHGMDPATAQEKLGPIIARMGEKFSLEGQWQNDTYVFSRSGIHGSIQVGPQDLHIQIELGMLMGALKPVIEQEIRQQLSKQLDLPKQV